MAEPEHPDSPARVGHAIVAAFNEGDRIGATVKGLRDAFPGVVVIVADDGSTDDTWDIAEAAGAVVVGDGKNRGKGAAASLAAERALHDGPPSAGSVVLLADADLADSAGRLAPLADEVAGGRADVSVAMFASRVGGGFGIALGFAHWAIKKRCGLETQAPISGQRGLTYEALRAVTPFRAGFGMEIGMTVDAVRAGLSVKEIELELAHRATGKTLRGFLHRGKQLRAFVAVYRETGRG